MLHNQTNHVNNRHWWAWLALQCFTSNQFVKLKVNVRQYMQDARSCSVPTISNALSSYFSRINYLDMWYSFWGRAASIIHLKTLGNTTLNSEGPRNFNKHLEHGALLRGRFDWIDNAQRQTKLPIMQLVSALWNHELLSATLDSTPSGQITDIQQQITKFLPSTMTRFCDRMTRLMSPDSPLSLPLMIITWQWKRKKEVGGIGDLAMRREQDWKDY
jgi:hypothetical protein